MAIEVVVPRIGWSMEKGTFSEWLKKEGEEVSPGDPLFSIEADKAIVDVASEDFGILHILPGRSNPGDELLVGTVVGFLLEPGEALPHEDGPDIASEVRQATASSPEPVGEVPDPVAGKAATERTAAGRTGPVSSPRARRTSREMGLDWRTLTGTGRGGRIIERDVRRAGTRLPGVPGSPEGAVSMSTLAATADVSDLLGLIERMRFPAGDPVGPLGQYRGLLVKLAATAYLHDFSVGSGNVDLAYGSHVDGGISFHSLREVNRKTVGSISREIGVMESTQAGLSGLEAFSLVDLEAYGIDEYFPGIPIPCGILLCVGRLFRGPAGTASTVRIGLSFREDFVSFANAARFLDNLRRALEDPLVWLA
jgi:pyruvate/2-oxoglutarate dehydrogenase complex dihydrolipoamide acyltransferase (E2) component